MKFHAGKYDYTARISREVACECYNTALHKLTSNSVPYNFNIQVGVGTTIVGKRYQVTLFRYVQNGLQEDVQCILNLSYGDTGTAELSVTYTTFGLMVEQDDSKGRSSEVMLWGD